METIKVGKRDYKVIQREETAIKYPAIHAHGTVAIITASFGKTIYVINERADGTCKARAAWMS